MKRIFRRSKTRSLTAGLLCTPRLDTRARLDWQRRQFDSPCVAISCPVLSPIEPDLVPQMACRLIHKALTGPKARRREAVNKEAMEEAWEGKCGQSDGPLALLRRRPSQRSSNAGWSLTRSQTPNHLRTSSRKTLSGSLMAGWEMMESADQHQI